MSEISTSVAPESADPPKIVLRSEIRELIRRTRLANKLTQAEVGGAIGINRTQMNRIEMGTAEISRHQADRLGAELGLPQLVEMISERERSDPGAETSRDKTVERLFELPGLETVTIVVADDLDVYRAVYDSRADTPLLDARNIDVVFPTVERERELFHGQPIYGHVEYQIKRLADLQDSDDRRLSNLRLFESDAVVASAVIARTRTVTACAYWAPLPVGGRVAAGPLPVASGTDPSTISRLEGYAAGLIDDANQIRVNQALCQVEPASDGGPSRSRFTRYFEVGTEQEEDVAEEEGFAVALVLTVALCPRKQYGVARRLITYRRPRTRHDRQRRSLFSNHVDAADIRGARAIERGSPPDTTRSRGGALAATLDIDEFIRSEKGDIPDLAFQIAAAREFRMFGLEIAPDRLRRVDLQPELQLINKASDDGPYRAAVAPRLFVLELRSDGGIPELDILSSNADIDEVGTSDMQTDDGNLNDFLHEARECNFLVPLLRQLKIADR